MLPVFKDDEGLLTHMCGVNIIGVGGHSMEEGEGPSLCQLSAPINTLNWPLSAVGTQSGPLEETCATWGQRPLWTMHSF